jgi:hypothetical protein
MWDDEQIDAAIDETARQMIAGEPGADFRARVVARLDAGSRRSVAGFAIRSWRPALAGLAVAALIIIVLVVSRDRQLPASRVASAPVSIVRLPEPDATSMVRLKPDLTYENSAPVRGFGGPRKPDATQVRLKPDATYDLEPLTTAPLDLDSIAVAALTASDSIDIEPLPLASPIAVTPLDVENQGDRR